MSTKEETPMMAQYRSIRRSLPEEIILFFRLGDFYEMFFDDAVRAASILDITLTKRNEVPMCGVPYHAAASYLEQLIKAEVKVAICEQVEDASQAKGVVRREVTRIVTPGTIIDEIRLTQVNSWLLPASDLVVIAVVYRLQRASIGNSNSGMQKIVFFAILIRPRLRALDLPSQAFHFPRLEL